MAGDLERFLQEAAERLANKMNQQGQGQRRPPRPPPVRQAERARIDPEILDAEIMEPEVVRAPQPREAGTNPLSRIDTRRRLAQKIGQADERMSEHIHEALDRDIVHIDDTPTDIVHIRDASAALQRDAADEAQGRGQVVRRQRAVNPLVNMLRQPDTLRAAFIASEIFKRKV